MYKDIVTQPAEETVVEIPSTWIPPKSDYWVGFDRYADGAAPSDMANSEQLRGWKFANACEAETVAYEDDMLDREYWSRGQW